MEHNLSKVIAAAENWCDYLEENDRDDEIKPIEDAIASLWKQNFESEGR